MTEFSDDESGAANGFDSKFPNAPSPENEFDASEESDGNLSPTPRRRRRRKKRTDIKAAHPSSDGSDSDVGTDAGRKFPQDLPPPAAQPSSDGSNSDVGTDAGRNFPQDPPPPKENNPGERGSAQPQSGTTNPSPTRFNGEKVMRTLCIIGLVIALASLACLPFFGIGVTVLMIAGAAVCTTPLFVHEIRKEVQERARKKVNKKTIEKRKVDVARAPSSEQVIAAAVIEDPNLSPQEAIAGPSPSLPPEQPVAPQENASAAAREHHQSSDEGSSARDMSTATLSSVLNHPSPATGQGGGPVHNKTGETGDAEEGIPTQATREEPVVAGPVSPRGVL